jgi:hypothetical protein
MLDGFGDGSRQFVYGAYLGVALALAACCGTVLM